VKSKLLFMALGILIGGAIGYRAKKPFIPEDFDTLSFHARYEKFEKGDGYKMTINQIINCPKNPPGTTQWISCYKTILFQNIFFK
jgi:hypothetical protein